MNGRKRVVALAFIDIGLIYISVAFAYLIERHNGLSNVISDFSSDMGLILFLNAAVKFICYYLCRFYGSVWRFAGIYEMNIVIKAVFISNAVVLFFVFLLQVQSLRNVFMVTFFTDMYLVGGSRLAYKVLIKYIYTVRKYMKSPKRVLIVSNGESGAAVVRELRSQSGLMGIPVAMVEDDRSRVGRIINGVPIIGQTLDIAAIVVKWKIDEVIIALPRASSRQINEIFRECSKTDCRVKILHSFPQLMNEPLGSKKIRDVNIEDLLGRDPVKFDIGRVSMYLENRVVLVTGGSGSIGSELCRQIAVYKPAKLIILDNYENTAYYVQNELMDKFPDLNLEIIIASIREKDRLLGIFEEYRPDVVFHAAAHKHVPLMEANPSEAVKNNVFGTLNLVECSNLFKVKRFVLISTDKAVNPTNIMGATKRIAEMIIQTADPHSSTEFVAVRFGNVLGSSGSVIPIFKRQIEEGGPVKVTHAEVTRFFMTIPEAVGLVMEAGAMAEGGEIFVLNMGEPVKIYDLAKSLIRLSGLEPDLDIKIEFTGLRPGEKLYEEILLNEEGLQSTENEKIFIAQPGDIDFAHLRRQLEELRNMDMNNTSALIDCIQTIVPTYKRPEYK